MVAIIQCAICRPRLLAMVMDFIHHSFIWNILCTKTLPSLHNNVRKVFLKLWFVVDVLLKITGTPFIVILCKLVTHVKTFSSAYHIASCSKFRPKVKKQKKRILDLLEKLK